MFPTQAQEAIAQLKNKVSAIPNGFNGRAVLLFSGGRDSSAVAAAFCHAFPNSELHLLAIDNGLLNRIDSPARQATLIKDLFPQVQVIFTMKRVSQMMRTVGMQKIEEDFTKHGFSTLLICVACKLVMNASAARYAKEQGIKLVLDGYAKRQEDFPEQTEECMCVIRKLFADSNITYLSPLYEFLSDKEKTMQTLQALGIYIPKQEATCMWANAFSKAKPEEITRYAEKTLRLVLEFNPLYQP